MIRIVRAPGGAVAVDRASTHPGRGAYVCPDPQCLALVRRRLAGSLRTESIDLGALVRDLEAVDA